MPYTKHQLIQIGIALASIFGIASIFLSVSGRYDIEVVQGFEAPAKSLVISEEKPLLLPLPHGDKQIAGVVVYAANNATAHATLRVNIQDKDGNILANKQRQISYYSQDGSPAIHIYFPQKYYATKQKRFLSITPFQKKQLALVTTPELALVYSLLYEEPVSEATKQGVLIGTALALSFFLLYVVRVHERWKWIGTAVIISIFSILATLPYVHRAGNWGIYDWDYRHSLAHIYQTTIRTYNQFPLWNPYICGGTAALGDPELALFTPSFLLQYIFGVENGTGIALSIGFIVTGIGILFLARLLKLDPFSALISAVSIIFCSSLMLKATEGHTTIIFAFMWVPWILGAWYLAYKSMQYKWVIVCAAFLAAALLQGGIYIVSYTAVSFIALCIFSHRRLHAVQISLYVLLWLIGLTSFQLIPALAWVKEFPDQAFVGSAYTYTRLWDIFFGRYLQNMYAISDQVSRWHEYGAYIGYGVFALVLIGISYVKASRIVRILLLGMVATLIVSSLGPLFEPILQYLRFLPRSNISRLVLFTLLCGGFLAGFGMKRLLSCFPHRYSMLPVIVASFIAIDLMSIIYPIAEQAFVIPPLSSNLAQSAPPITYTPETFEVRHSGSDTPRAYGATLKGYGTFTFCSVIGPKSAVTVSSPNDTPPSFIQSKQEANTKLLFWSPNKITFSYEASESVDISINANYTNGWQTSHGSMIKTNSLVTARVPAGKDTVTLRYQPPGMRIGLLITVITIATIYINRRKIFYAR